MLSHAVAAILCRSASWNPLPSPSPGLRCTAFLLTALIVMTMPRMNLWAATPEGVWLIDGKAAVQIFDCRGLLCGRILWLQSPRDLQGQLNRDRNNPDFALRQRPLCGLTILWGLRFAGPGRWDDGWFYNPDNGRTYRVSAQLSSDDLIVARVYLGVPFFGETKRLLRVPHGTSEGWC